MITGMNNDECHVLEKVVNISKRSVQIWPAIVPAGHYIGDEAGHWLFLYPMAANSISLCYHTVRTKFVEPEVEELDKTF